MVLLFQLMTEFLVKDQSTASQNGIYVVAASPARAADLAAGANAAGMFTFVRERNNKRR